MISARIASVSILCITLLFSGTQAARADAVFDFEADLAGTPSPFTDTVNGLSAAFGGSASVCDSTGLVQSLTGKVLIQSFCGPSPGSGPRTIAFSSDLTGISFKFANAGGTSTLTLAAFENATSIGTATFTSTLPPGLFNGEGMASFSGTFNRLTLTSGALLALDNINASTSSVPEPASFATIASGVGLLAAFARKRKR